jgi:hypothetical protein
MNETHPSVKENFPANTLLQRLRYPIGACLVLFCFLSFIYNRFLPAQDAWFPNYAEMIKEGHMPYRDFYCVIQPIPLLISRFLVEWSDKLIYFRYYACAERLALACSLYWMLRAQFSRFSSFVGTVASVIVVSSSAVDALFSYFITCLLFSVVALGALARAVADGPGRGRFFIISGLFLALSFYTKQSYGGMIGISFFLILALVSRSWMLFFQSLVKIGTGFSLVGLPLSLGLLLGGLSSDYLIEVYCNVVAQKGGPSAILTGFFSRLNLTPYLIVVSLTAGVLALLFISGVLKLRRPESTNPKNETLLFYGTVILFLLALILPLRFVDVVVPWMVESRIYISLLYLVPLVFYAVVALLVFILLNRRRMFEGGATCNRGLLVMTVGSLAGLYAMGMSYEISANAMLPALGIVLAFVIDFFQLGRRRVMVYLAVFAAVFLVFVGGTKKYLNSYWWYGWEDTSLHPSGYSRIPQFAGFNLDPDEVEIYDHVVDLIEKNVGPREQLFTFPNCPMFNYLTHHPQPTFAPSHYFDVSPDSIDETDAARLLRNPPRMIIWLRASPAELAVQELSFRGGHRSGYSEMEDALKKLTLSGGYERLYRRLYNEQSFPIEVWKRTGDTNR